MSRPVDDEVLEWLLAPRNPTARWLTLRLLLNRADDDPEVLEAQRAVPDSPWAQAVLAGQRPDGSWPRGRTSKPELRATLDRLSGLAGLGMPADDPRVVATCELLLERTELPGEGFSMKKTEPRAPHECGQGMLLFALNHFGYGSDRRVKAAATWLLANQMLDGGWNCAHPGKGRLQHDGVIRMNHECAQDLPHHKSSLFSTMAVLKGLATMNLESRAVDGRWPADDLAPAGRPNKWVTVHALHVLRVLQPATTS